MGEGEINPDKGIREEQRCEMWEGKVGFAKQTLKDLK